jgi:hypothetical protein
VISDLPGRDESPPWENRIVNLKKISKKIEGKYPPAIKNKGSGRWVIK